LSEPPPLPGSGPPLDDASFAALRALVYAQAGVVVREELRGGLRRRLGERLPALGLEDFDTYLSRIRQGELPHELEEVLDVATTHETYFFREPVQLEGFVREVLPAIARQQAASRRLRLWSAGCSSGEEAYTLAMLLAESGHFSGFDVQIYGTDLSRRMIDLARRAEYGAAALRATSGMQRQRYFELAPNGRHRVSESIRSMVSFAQVNLIDPDQAEVLPPMDAIFCRNVLIYMDEPARRRTLRILFDRLHGGGLLLLGHAEHLLGLETGFELVHLEHDLIYRRPAGGAG